MTNKPKDLSPYLGRSLSQTLILSLLSKRKMSGYSLIKEIKEISLQLAQGNSMVKYKVGTLYGYIAKMEEQGLLIQSEEAGERAIDKKSVYELSKKGFIVYQEQLKDWNTVRSIIDGILGSGDD